MAIGAPADGGSGRRAIVGSGGWARAVSDGALVDGIRLLARTEGIFEETAGGVTIACLAKRAASGVVRREERVVVYITGIGLKPRDAVD